MLGFRTFITSLKQISQNRADYFFLFYHFLMFSGRIRQLNISSDTNLVIYLFITVLYSLVMRRLRINVQLSYIIIIFFIISLPSLFLFDYSIVPYIGFIIRLIIAYLIVNYFRSSFIKYFENLMFILAYISIPLYLIQILFPQFYNIFTPFTQMILPDVYANSASSSEFQYLLVFGVNGWATLRNSGMFSEPSVYASMLAWAMIINLSINKYRTNPHFVVLFITSITLFSIGMIIYLIPISLVYIINNFKKRYLLNLLKAVIIVSVFFLVFMKTDLFVKQYEMISRKIQMEEQNREMLEKEILGRHDVSRVTGALVNLEFFLHWPFGYGFYRSETGYYKYLGVSPNGLATQLSNWGIAFILILLTSAYRFSKILQLHSHNKSIYNFILVMIIFIFPISGTSLSNEPLYLSILLWPILVYKEYMHLKFESFYLKTNFEPKRS